mgnify:CR=1 FL=1
MNTCKKEFLAELINKVLVGDCIQLMKKIPDESIDLIFIDPPYNLRKRYLTYNDEKSDEEYLRWSKKWLLEAVRILKRTGSLFVVNLPKWAWQYILILNEKLWLQRVIAWFGLSEPRGKIMPAHYPILWYTKSKDNFKFNKNTLEKIHVHPRYVCLRQHCKEKIKRMDINERKKLGIYEELTDVWFDIHRIRHRGKRIEKHPCQLPEKLLERIILMTTNINDVVLDPMVGTGTTVIVAKKLNRKFIGIDIDPYYVQITNKRLKTVNVSLTSFFANF